jgi:twitching motility protein PilT
VVSQRLIPRADGRGRVPAVEVMLGTAVIRDCIREARRTPDIPAFMAQGASHYGMQTFDQCLLALYRDGLISYEIAKDTATSPDDFDLKVRGILSTGEVARAPDATKSAPVIPAAPPAPRSPFARP